MELGVCGYGYTGSGALSSMLKEFDGTSCLAGNYGYEFTLSYVTDGLEDLEFALCQNPSKGTRCDIAIYRFGLLINTLERGYNRFTGGQFRAMAESYIEDLTQVKFKAVRVFEYERSPYKIKRYERLVRGFLSRWLKNHKLPCRTFPLVDRYLSVYPENFLERTRQFVSDILTSSDAYKCLLLDQPFSVGNPLNSMRFFKDPRCIIVDRDPRDLYVMVKNVYGMNAMFIPSDTVEHFIEYYRRIHDDRLWKGSDKVLRFQFEDLIYKYEEAIESIKNFVGPVLGNHAKPKEFFKPEVSIANTNVFGKFPEDAEAIKQIEKELPEFLYHFEEGNKSSDSNVDLNYFTYC